MIDHQACMCQRFSKGAPNLVLRLKKILEGQKILGGGPLAEKAI